jgi:hypothetical protein
MRAETSEAASRLARQFLRGVEIETLARTDHSFPDDEFHVEYPGEDGYIRTLSIVIRDRAVDMP